MSKIDRRKKAYRQILILVVLISGILIGAVMNKAQAYANEKQKEIESQWIFGNPDFLSPEGNISIEIKENNGWIPAPKLTEQEPTNPVEAYTKLVLKYLPKYYPDVKDQSRIMPVFSCLLRNESGHYINKGFGDGGKAGGIVQFHESTYIGYRKIMMENGHVDHMGDRMDPEDAIETMIWAFSDGRGEAWGPFLRGECK